MCGIAGLIHRGKSTNVGGEMQNMLQSLKHRGPDSTGYALYGDSGSNDYVLRFKVGENVKEGSTAVIEDDSVYQERKNNVNSEIADAGAKIIRRIKIDVEEKLKLASTKAGLLLIEAKERARENMTATLGKERERLEALKSINPSVRQEELVQLKQRISATKTYIEKSSLELQGIRVIITT